MTDAENSGDPSKWLRRFARGIGSPFAAFYVFMGLGSAFFDPEPVTAEGVMVAVLFSGGVLGVLIAWWREKIGELVLVVDAIVLVIFVYVTAGHNRVGAALLIPCPLLVSGVLFLMSWRKSVRPAVS